MISQSLTYNYLESNFKEGFVGQMSYKLYPILDLRVKSLYFDNMDEN